VSAKEAPDYYEIIKHPIDMGEIRKKIRDMEYKDKEEFLSDFKWIRLNCFKYNEHRNPHLIPMVDTVYSTVVEEVNKVTDLDMKGSVSPSTNVVLLVERSRAHQSKRAVGGWRGRRRNLVRRGECECG